ncbi:hypothetical protein BDY24DRAFT_394937 [Mrakia frigida]|uniref:SRR1 family protein n=1 Tax=Mrakia frigida TaxID=29902 RepID=UPI003FCBF71A
MVCFGLGSLENSRIAQMQLLLLLDLSKRLNITSMEAYDPAFTSVDELLLGSYSISVLPTNTHGHHPLPSDDSTTLVYMPHCPRTLYQNFLFSNWSEDALGRLILLSNEISGYVVREPLKKLQALAPCLPLIVPHLETHLLPPNFPPNDVFNDLAFHWVPKGKLSKVGEGEGEGSWERPEPTEEREEKDEIV